MAKAKTLAQSAADVAKGIDRAALATLLAGKVTPPKRAPLAARWKAMANALVAELQDPLRNVRQAPRRRAPSRRAGSRAYMVVSPNAYKNARPGTWRRFMLQTILSHGDTVSATKAHKESAMFTDKALDFNWTAKQGYIAYN